MSQPSLPTTVATISMGNRLGEHRGVKQKQSLSGVRDPKSKTEKTRTLPLSISECDTQKITDCESFHDFTVIPAEGDLQENPALSLLLSFLPPGL